MGQVLSKTKLKINFLVFLRSEFQVVMEDFKVSWAHLQYGDDLSQVSPNKKVPFYTTIIISVTI